MKTIRTVTIVEELDALPDGTVVRVIAPSDPLKHGIACEKDSGRWYSTKFDYSVTGAELLDKFASVSWHPVFQVLWPHECECDCPQPMTEWERELLEKGQEPVTADSMADDLAAAIQTRDQALAELKDVKSELAEAFVYNQLLRDRARTERDSARAELKQQRLDLDTADNKLIEVRLESVRLQAANQALANLTTELLRAIRVLMPNE